MSDCPIHEFLTDYAQSGTLRCHMPGHKGTANPLDITEISGADSLFEADGIIARSEGNAARLFGADSTLYSCGGSTLSIQTMLAIALTGSAKRRILAGRYSHKSLVSACALLGAELDWLYPDEYLSCVISPEAVERGITLQTCAIFINSIDYYGGESDISAIAEVCRRHNVPLLVDNAHGAYHVFTDSHPIKLGAAMCADSAHKTLPVLTGGAYLHICSEYAQRAKELMSLFGSSSPSYLILDSLDLCNDFIANSKEIAKGAFEAVGYLKARLVELGFSLKKSDKLRVTVNTTDYGYYGEEFAQQLRDNGIECEMADSNRVVLLFSVIDNMNTAERVLAAMLAIERKAPVLPKEYPVLRPKVACSPREALLGESEEAAVTESSGRVCAEVMRCCPPCVPLVMPGEIIGSTETQTLLQYGIEKIRVLKKQ